MTITERVMFIEAIIVAAGFVAIGYLVFLGASA